MKTQVLSVFLIAALFAACAKSSSEDTTSNSEVSDALQSQLSSINTSTGDINTGSSSTLSLLSPSERRFLNEKNIWQRLGGYVDKIFESELHAMSFNCSSGGFSDNPSASSSFGTTTVNVMRTWSNCVGDSGQFKRNGIVYLGWTGLNTSANYIQNGAVLKRATSGLTMTSVSSGNVVSISGNDSTDAISGNNANQVITWTSGTNSSTSRTFTLSINETRSGQTAAGATLFKHVITTPTVLTVTADTSASTRTIASGSVNLHHSLANFDVTTTFSNAVWSMASCQPTSGSATITVSGSISGSGTLTFNNGTVSFTYGKTSGSVTLPGC